MKPTPPPPSMQAAREWHQRQKGALGKVIASLLLRSLVIGAGLRLSGEKNQDRLVKHAIVASASIEAFILYWTRIKHA
tara:strand:- start:98 stop:331 length:234 start_codon:yes stop_codon:yes gene_type:complete